MQDQLHAKWKWPNVKAYNGTSNSKAHVKSYIT